MLPINSTTMIRALTASDLDEFISIRKEMLASAVLSFGADPDRHIDRDQTARDLEAKNSENFILGYYDGDTLLGMVGCMRNVRKKERHKAMIWGMYVRPAGRGKGIGRKLISEAVHKISLVDGVDKVHLSVTSAAGPARSLYESVGFQAFGVERDSIRWEGEVVDEVFMELVF